VIRCANHGNESSPRSAIDASTRAAGCYLMEIEVVRSPTHVIEPNAPPPPIKGLVRIQGMAWRRTGEFIFLDGAGYTDDKGPQTCPGAVPGASAE
jgi:3-dehydroshikimate dehydratase